ncbi:hypothetical protein EVAR_12544_1 [Eumeta japonica]|uniref:Uncharacterized protein n=1 Tax=Eumeta variegata TaxID=151549 RepID=A0A4C1TPQ8_EUMVA|nr:hypothetical protein EVAR_12544_1 [Eumeta japonica]
MKNKQSKIKKIYPVPNSTTDKSERVIGSLQKQIRLLPVSGSKIRAFAGRQLARRVARMFTDSGDSAIAGGIWRGSRLRERHVPRFLGFAGIRIQYTDPAVAVELVKKN